MTRDEWMAAFAVGGIILAGMLTKTKDGIAWGEGWHWPVPDLMLNGAFFPAVISQEYKGPAVHPGVDIMYRRRSPDDLVAAFPPNKADATGAKATAMHFAPAGTPIVAAKDAKVWAVFPSSIGWVVVLDHGKPWATRYLHLATVALDRHVNGRRDDGGAVQEVRAGDQIGTMGFSPTDGGKVRHLHFEAMYKGGNNAATVDPAAVMQSWGRSQWTP